MRFIYMYEVSSPIRNKIDNDSKILQNESYWQKEFASKLPYKPSFWLETLLNCLIIVRVKCKLTAKDIHIKIIFRVKAFDDNPMYKKKKP